MTEELDFEGILKGALEGLDEGEEDEEVDFEDDEDVEDYDPDIEEEDEEIEEPEDEDEEEPEEDDEEDLDSRKPQSREENARFAEMRRQQQLQQQMEQSVEYKTAKALADMYGVTVDELYAQIEQKKLEEEAEKQGVSVEYLKELNTTKEENVKTRQELDDLRFQLWEIKVNNEADSIKKEYPMLTEDDMYDAKDYLLRTIQNPNMPLEQAVFALHGKKIAEGLKKTMRNEALAEVSGRKKAPSAPSGGKSSAPVILTDDERFIIQQLGIPEEDYIKNMRK